MARGVKTGGRRNRDRVVIKFYGSRAARDRLDELAAEQQVPRSELIRRLLSEAIKGV